MSTVDQVTVKRRLREHFLWIAALSVIAIILLVALSFGQRVYVTQTSFVGGLIGVALGFALHALVCSSAAKANDTGIEIRDISMRTKKISWTSVEKIELWHCTEPVNRKVRKIVIIGKGPDADTKTELGTITETTVRMPIDELYTELQSLWSAAR